MESPLVSIIVPIYNSAMDMVPCLESIKRQRYEDRKSVGRERV